MKQNFDFFLEGGGYIGPIVRIFTYHRPKYHRNSVKLGKSEIQKFVSLEEFFSLLAVTWTQMAIFGSF